MRHEYECKTAWQETVWGCEWEWGAGSGRGRARTRRNRHNRRETEVRVRSDNPADAGTGKSRCQRGQRAGEYSPVACNRRAPRGIGYEGNQIVGDRYGNRESALSG